eukprot:TRINITY_DN9908_c0_g1_i1.p1 TRINITY_DN9908_c0_g1~~TRINITY_DN9908_c0_g1_i1.p1  ORF type:complete len:219 (-),score=37.10 TRINITY_DN9908_c0_g1_i1:114-770(-)
MQREETTRSPIKAEPNTRREELSKVLQTKASLRRKILIDSSPAMKKILDESPLARTRKNHQLTDRITTEKTTRREVIPANKAAKELPKDVKPLKDTVQEKDGKNTKSSSGRSLPKIQVRKPEERPQNLLKILSQSQTRAIQQVYIHGNFSGIKNSQTTRNQPDRFSIQAGLELPNESLLQSPYLKEITDRGKGQYSKNVVPNLHHLIMRGSRSGVLQS